jgi:hypothetical protein
MTGLTHLDVHAPGASAALRLDEATGLPVALLPDDVPLTLALEVVWGGEEATRPIGGLEYPGAERLALDALELVATRREDHGDHARVVAIARQDAWEVELSYALHDRAPHVALGFTLRRAPGAAPVALRDVVVSVGVGVEDRASWALHAPGNQQRPGVELADVDVPLRIFSAADTFGSPGLVALSAHDDPATITLWPLCRTELGGGRLEVADDGATLVLTTNLAGRVDDAAGLTWGTVWLDAARASWEAVRDQLPAWYQRFGIAAPADRPAWLAGAHVYEAHIGFSVFADGVRYERYPEVADLRADLDRLQALGFDVLQLMPRHPYPSYNVHDYADVTTTYGDEAQLRDLVDECHRRGMRVIVDIILHGLIDQEVMADTLAGVHAGPYADRLGEGTIAYLLDTAEDVAWSRHIVEYAPYWSAGSPERAALADEHPEWFMKDSAGTITRRYTKAFDIASPAWQAYFLDACLDLVARLDVDGFRVDAPTYNNYATWSEGRGHRAGYGAMASLGLLEELRTRLRAAKPEAIVYTEPTGALFRGAVDATYNYDEHWLVESLYADARNPQRPWRLVRDARDLARWLGERDRALPPGAGIIHHVDSHDSIWWRLPGQQWRRERFGAEATVALTALFALATPGGFMTFMGGEDQIQDELTRALALRREHPELATGRCEYLPEAASCDDVLVARRTLDGREALVVVNLGPDAIDCHLGLDAGPVPVADLWSGEDVDLARPVALASFQPRVLRLA